MIKRTGLNLYLFSGLLTLVVLSQAQESHAVSYGSFANCLNEENNGDTNGSATWDFIPRNFCTVSHHYTGRLSGGAFLQPEHAALSSGFQWTTRSYVADEDVYAPSYWYVTWGEHYESWESGGTQFQSIQLTGGLTSCEEIPLSF